MTTSSTAQRHSWTRPADLRAQVQKLWDRGDLLTSLVTDEAIFPKRLLLKSPTSAELSGHFNDVRTWISELAAVPYCRVEMHELKHRLLGTNSVPRQAWIDSVGDALALIGKQRDAARFKELIAMTRQRQPTLLVWLAKRPLRALQLSSQWTLLLDIVAWLQQNPRPNVYLRQVDIAGVHSKLIEAHRGVLTELLNIALPPEAIDANATGINQFAQRFGFLDKPLRIRFRMLDSERSFLPGPLPQDITLDADSFARLAPNVDRVFITENEINFLAFPSHKNSMIIFGAGYGFETLRKASWLPHCAIHYWGDIDTHGFAILDQLRSQFRHAQSFLMDRNTLLKFEPLWGEEEQQTLRDLPRLNADENALYDDLRDNRIRKNLRLEQEKIAFGWVQLALEAAE